METDTALALFTKPPRPGRVKTRLIGPRPDGLTPEEAAELHWAFVLDQLERLEGGDFDLRIAWALEPGEAAPELGVAGFAQEGPDLGARLWHGLELLARGARAVAAVGSDHPGLTLPRVREAFERLAAGADLVLGPAADGGYYLVAVAADRLDRSLFDGVAWSTPSVLGQTLERARRLGLLVEQLAPADDVDTPEDLARLALTLRAGAAGCPRTRRLLDAWGRLEP